MEEKRPTPLPPGVMPSSSSEDLYAQLQADSDARRREEKLLRPVRGMYTYCSYAAYATCGLCAAMRCRSRARAFRGLQTVVYAGRSVQRRAKL